MATLKITHDLGQTPAGVDVGILHLDGMISTTTLGSFRQHVADLQRQTAWLLLDFAECVYINSSGLGELVRMDDDCVTRGGGVRLVNVPPSTAQLMDMLGLRSVLHLYADIDTCMQSIDAGTSLVPPLESAPVEQGEPLPLPALPEARILLCVRGGEWFGRLLARTLTGTHRHIKQTTTAEEAQEHLRTQTVDIMVMETDFPRQEDCLALAYGLEHPPTTVMVQPQGSIREKLHPLRHQVDSIVAEPFDLRELAALVEDEFARRQSFVRELTLAFYATEEPILRAVRMLDQLLQQTPLNLAERAGYHQALREAIDNAYRHGNDKDADKRIRLYYCQYPDRVEAEISDEGGGFNFDSAVELAQSVTPLERARQQHEAGKRGGLGICLMVCTCDEVSFNQPGNRVRLVKRFTTENVG